MRSSVQKPAPAASGLSTGLVPLDRFLGGLRYGDNVVWESNGVDETPLVSAFLEAARGAPLVYVAFHVGPEAILERFGEVWDRRGFILLDCFTDGIAGGDPAAVSFYEQAAAETTHGVRRVRELRIPDALGTLLREYEMRLGRGARYVFDTLTGAQDLWGGAGALALFLQSCPRLYQLRTAAYWLVQQAAHDPAFLSRLRHVTQVVVELHTDRGAPLIRLTKAEGRPPAMVGSTARIAYEHERLVLKERSVDEVSFGQLLKAHRIARGLGQAELARRIGISPSALSQAERGRSGLAPETMERARDVLGLPDDLPRARASYRLSRRGSRAERPLGSGMTVEELARTASHSARLVRIEAGSTGRQVPFATKHEELLVVTSGVLEVRVGEAREVLHAGDALLLRDEPLSGWRNPGPEQVELIWSVLPRA